MKVLVFLCFLILGCQKDTSHSSPRSLALGKYLVTGPFCVSSLEAPDYPSIAKKLALYDFDGIEEISWDIGAVVSTKKYKTEGCTMTINKGIFRNSDDFFSFRQSKTFSWSPEDCRLYASAGGDVGVADPQYYSEFETDEDNSEDILFSVVQQKSVKEYQLISADLDSLNSVWQNFGCAKIDQIYFELSTK